MGLSFEVIKIVRTEIEEVWKCSYCQNKYQHRRDAINCAEECTDIEYPKEIDTEVFYCEYCNSRFYKNGQAELCESDHIQKQDKYYLDYEQKRSRKKLIEAADHHQQTRIIQT